MLNGYGWRFGKVSTLDKETPVVEVVVVVPPLVVVVVVVVEPPVEMQVM